MAGLARPRPRKPSCRSGPCPRRASHARRSRPGALLQGCGGASVWRLWERTLRATYCHVLPVADRVRSYKGGAVHLYGACGSAPCARPIATCCRSRPGALLQGCGGASVLRLRERAMRGTYCHVLPVADRVRSYKGVAAHLGCACRSAPCARPIATCCLSRTGSAPTRGCRAPVADRVRSYRVIRAAPAHTPHPALPSHPAVCTWRPSRKRSRRHPRCASRPRAGGHCRVRYGQSVRPASA